LFFQGGFVSSFAQGAVAFNPDHSVVTRSKGWLKDQSRSGAFLEMWA
jgi:hypothetical protein